MGAILVSVLSLKCRSSGPVSVDDMYYYCPDRGKWVLDLGSVAWLSRTRVVEIFVFQATTELVITVMMSFLCLRTPKF